MPAYISIHALREEGDTSVAKTPCAGANFYPRPPRGGRPIRPAERYPRETFLSTPSARRATWGVAARALRILFLSTPSARRATARITGFILFENISIHALREEGDPCPDRPYNRTNISIHALREEGDRTVHGDQKLGQDISIHALREEGDSYQRGGSI